MQIFAVELHSCYNFSVQTDSDYRCHRFPMILSRTNWGSLLQFVLRFLTKQCVGVCHIRSPSRLIPQQCNFNPTQYKHVEWAVVILFVPLWCSHRHLLRSFFFFPPVLRGWSRVGMSCGWSWRAASPSGRARWATWRGMWGSWAPRWSGSPWRSARPRGTRVGPSWSTASTRSGSGRSSTQWVPTHGW